MTLAELAALTKDKGIKYLTAAVPRDAPARLTAASALRDSKSKMLYMLEEFCDETATLLAAWFDGRPQTNSPAKILRWRAAATPSPITSGAWGRRCWRRRRRRRCS